MAADVAPIGLARSLGGLLGWWAGSPWFRRGRPWLRSAATRGRPRHRDAFRRCLGGGRLDAGWSTQAGRAVRGIRPLGGGASSASRRSRSFARAAGGATATSGMTTAARPRAARAALVARLRARLPRLRAALAGHGRGRGHGPRYRNPRPPWRPDTLLSGLKPLTYNPAPLVPQHDVLVIGAGLAGQRAALAAAEAGRLGRASSPRSTPCARTPTPPRAGSTRRSTRTTRWESHAFDTIKGSDYLGDQDAIEIMCREAPEEVLHLEHLGVTFHRNEEGRARHPRLRRRLAGAHLLRRRHHRPGDHARALRAADEALRADLPLRGVLHDGARDRRRRPVRRRGAAQHPRRLDGALRRQGRDPRHRRQRPDLAPDDQRPDLHRRRDRDGLRGRRRADGHGDGPVPPDDARAQGLPDHRGRPRRGRAPAERQGRAVHGALRARTRWSSPPATSSPAPSRPRSTRGAASPTARSRSTSPWCRASASTRRCARSCSSAATSRASTSPASRSTSSPATTT